MSIHASSLKAVATPNICYFYSLSSSLYLIAANTLRIVNNSFYYMFPTQIIGVFSTSWLDPELQNINEQPIIIKYVQNE